MAVTAEQANEALQQLMAQRRQSEVAEEPAPQPVAVTQVAEAEPAAEEAAPAEAPAGDEPAEPTVAAGAGDDDVASLKQRLEAAVKERETAQQTFQERLAAMSERTAQNERVLRDKFLRKATAADQALKILKRTRTTEGVPEHEVDRIIGEVEGTMNPASQSYAPPPQAVEDHYVTLNAFLNEKQMTRAEEAAFGKWLRVDASTVLTPQEQHIAERDADSFLRIAHDRWQSHVAKQATSQQATVAAVKSIQRAQQATAKAATVAPAAPRKQSTAPQKDIDVRKLTAEDISALVRATVDTH